MACRNLKIARMREELYSCSASIKKTSEAKKDDAKKVYGNPPRKYVVEGKNAESFIVSEFDAVQSKWYPDAEGRNHPCSVDAVHLDHSGCLYAIEFKIGQVETANLIRKIHETIMGMKENLGPISRHFESYEFYRTNMIYLIVASELEEQTPSERTFYRTYYAYDEPWELQKFPLRWKLKSLEGVVVSRVYELAPSMFSRFAKKKGWYKR